MLSIQTSALRASPHYVNLHYCGSELASSTMGLNLTTSTEVLKFEPSPGKEDVILSALQEWSREAE